MNLVALPLHIWERELDARCLLAVALADCGATVLIGNEHNFMPIYGSYRNIFHFAAGRPLEDTMYRRKNSYISRCSSWYTPIIENDGYVGLVFEEGINDLFNSSSSELKSLYSPITLKSINSLTKYYSWTSIDQSQILNCAPSSLTEVLRPKLLVSSNLRIEMCGVVGRKYFKKDITALDTLFQVIS